MSAQLSPLGEPDEGISENFLTPEMFERASYKYVAVPVEVASELPPPLPQKDATFVDFTDQVIGQLNAVPITTWVYLRDHVIGVERFNDRLREILLDEGFDPLKIFEGFEVRPYFGSREQELYVGSDSYSGHGWDYPAIRLKALTQLVRQKDNAQFLWPAHKYWERVVQKPVLDLNSKHIINDDTSRELNIFIYYEVLSALDTSGFLGNLRNSVSQVLIPKMFDPRCSHQLNPGDQVVPTRRYNVVDHSFTLDNDRRPINQYVNITGQAHGFNGIRASFIPFSMELDVSFKE